MRAWVGVLAVAAACAGARPAVPVAPASELRAFAHVTHPVTLVQGSEQLAFSFDDRAWLRIDASGVHDDAPVAHSLAALGDQIGGDTLALFLGRTPLVAGTDANHAAIARAGDANPRAAPGVVRDVIRLGASELWRYETATDAALALVDAADAVRALPLPPRLGPAVAAPARCERPGVVALAAARDGAAALVTECAPGVELRIEHVGATGGERWQHMRALDELELGVLLIDPRSAPVLAGNIGGRLAFARGTDDGSWQITATQIPLGSVQHAVWAADGALWTLTTVSGPDGHDRWTLARDGQLVELHAPDGRPLSVRDIGVDRDLGIVAKAHPTEGDPADWLLAQHAPSGVRELP